MKYIILTSIFIVAGCASSTRVNESQSLKSQPGLIPLAIGNTWVYKNKINPKVTVSSSIEKTQKAHGNTWFLYNEMGERFWVRNQGFSQYEVTSSYEENAISISNFEEALVLAKPDGKEKSYYLEGHLITYKPCSKPIEVMAGTFNCHVYTFDLGNGHYSTSYYAKNIGLILNQFNSENGYEEFELYKYNLQ